MDNQIQILVTGTVGSGKTMISQEIVEALRNLGFAVKWEVKPDYENEGQARRLGVNRLKTLETLTDKATIFVKEMNVKKDFIASLNYRMSEYVKKEKE